MVKRMSEVAPNGKVELPYNALREFPEIAQGMMATVEAWSHIDANLTYLFSTFLRTDIATATAVFARFTSAHHRTQALKAAGEEALPEWQNLLLRAVLKLIEPSREVRNSFAHSVTGRSPDAPSSVLLLDAMVGTAVSVSHRQPRKSLPSGGSVIAPQDFDREKIEVWTANDVLAAAAEAQECYDYVSRLAMAIGYRRNEVARRELLNDPRVREKLEPLLKGSSHFISQQLAPPGEDPPAPGVWRSWDERLGRDMSYWSDRDEIQ